jgi:hypothetical protein
MAAMGTTGEQQSQEQHNYNREDDPEHLHPQWSAGVVVDVAVRARVSHVR